MPIRTIMIFPQFQNMEVIDEIRKKYDPLCELVKPHITLVFPFDSNISDSKLRGILERQLNEIQPFKICLQGVSKQEDRFGKFLFLDVVDGTEILQTIHNRLYTTELKMYESGDRYVPHMTIGSLQTSADLETAYQTVKGMTQPFYTVVDTISVEMIGKNEESIIIIEKKLRGELC